MSWLTTDMYSRQERVGKVAEELPVRLQLQGYDEGSKEVESVLHARMRQYAGGRRQKRG